MISRNSLIAIVGFLLLFLMMTFISQYVVEKSILMLFMVFLIKKEITNLSIKVRVIFGLIIFYGLYGVFIGAIYQNPNPLLFITVYFIYPLFYALCLTLLVKNNYFNTIIRIIFFSHFFIVLYDLLYVCGVIFSLPIPNIYSVENPFTLYDGASRMNFVNLNTLTFSTPLLFVLFIAKFEFKVSRIFQGIVLFVTFIVLLLSGRRSVMGMILILPVLPFIFSGHFNKKIKSEFKKLIIIFLSTILIFLYKVNLDNPKILEAYSEKFLSAFDSKQEPIKFAQGKMLLEKFIEKPIFGHGSGARFYEPSPGRGSYGDQFELSYHFKLAINGIFGFSIIVGVYLWILFYGLYLSKKKKDVILLSFLMGYLLMLISDASNPVLTSFDLIWPIYICLARINYLELNNTEIN